MPYCPKCRSEYRDGFFKCSDCDEPLVSRDITYYVKGEHFLTVRPLVDPAAVMVDEEQYEEARELLKDFKGRFTGLAPRDGGE